MVVAALGALGVTSALSLLRDSAAVLLTPVDSVTGEAMTPEPSFKTVQLQRYIELLRAGDGQATDAFLRRVCGRLERLARGMLRGFPNVRRWADSGDVLRGALMRILHTLERTQPENTRHFANLTALLIRCELIDLARHFRCHLDRNPEAPGADGEGAADLPDPHSALGADLDLWSAFHEQVEEREVVSLLLYHGWTHLEIAELFQVDQRTIRRRWRSAALKLNQGPRRTTAATATGAITAEGRRLVRFAMPFSYSEIAVRGDQADGQ
jgi:DNA-directed RNA polymerase specialized sigma24 family protein